MLLLSASAPGHATGFVVDKRRGLLLTNRHVVTDGPVTADAIFMSKEEVQLVAFYRDPVHDFGLFRFDPAAVQHQTLEEIELAPDEARPARPLAWLSAADVVAAVQPPSLLRL